ncbi:MAG TPA: bifunctional glutamate N-acetyltransferase/amino-acid acetyltransferase ArgJ [Planctomycetota bacterium]|nr:bifunctional glutamate N-acetyltransferase/amino-acid acetyltransferase ArgJ [Planctomycetota bacterium]
MTVLLEPVPDRVPLPPGFRAAGVHCGLKKAGQLDLGLLLADQPVEGAAIYTQNRLVGAHIHVCRDHLRRSNGLVRALLVNARNANCATGSQGVEHARTCCRQLAERLRCPTEQVLMASTGPIGAPLPVDTIVAHLDALLERASGDGALDFARAIMTTDSYPKALHASTPHGAVTGFAKGSGMIHPDMATMLGFLLTDGRVGDSRGTPALLQRVADRSFHRTTVDGDTSPNDTLFLFASGRHHSNPTELEGVLTTLGQQLARRVAADGEGCTRLITVQVRGARSESEATQVGRVIASSPLVKTAIAGLDPNWGRILSAAGRAAVPFSTDAARVWIGSAEVFRHGVPHPEKEREAHRHLADSTQVVLGVDLAVGTASADVWTCDLTRDYVQINADYRT